MTRARQSLLLLPVMLVALGVALYLAATWQRHVAVRAAGRTQVANRLLIAMLDQETGLRGYALTAREEFLTPWTQGTAAFERALDDSGKAFGADRRSVLLVAQERVAARRWQQNAQDGIDFVRRNGPHSEPLANYSGRKLQFDDFRARSAALLAHLDRRRDSDLATAERLATLGVLALIGLLGAAAWALMSRHSRAQRRLDGVEIDFRNGQREFADVVAVVQEETEAHEILKRHVERSLPDARATILSRNNSENRLEAATDLADGSALSLGLQDAEPRSCLAVRLARTHTAAPGEDALLSCEVCGVSADSVMCEPLLVGGEVIGALLVEHVEPLDEMRRRRVAESVSQAAPVIANLRNLARAENRAATDALTGLPNRRAVNDTLKRMSAHAQRTGSPMAALALDLDHFKLVNDRWGHEKGDLALATFGELLAGSIRASDLGGRVGGEEFVVLAPDTDRAGALVLAENLRLTISRMDVDGVADAFSASIGVAVLPEDSDTPDGLLRLADRALYAAKAAGRNRVVAAEAPLPA
jgi:diguanylate cyclase (GGDEF)-like protein